MSESLGARVLRLGLLALLLVSGAVALTAVAAPDLLRLPEPTATAVLHAPKRAKPVQRAATEPEEPEATQVAVLPSEQERALAAAQEAAAQEAAAARAEEQAERDRARRERNQRDRDERALAQARRAVAITMYTTSWCRVCDRAREHMRGEGIAFRERNVEHDRAAAARARELNPRGSVPTFDIDGAPYVGFSPGGLRRAIDDAAKRRVTPKLGSLRPEPFEVAWLGGDDEAVGMRWHGAPIVIEGAPPPRWNFVRGPALPTAPVVRRSMSGLRF